MTVLAVIGGTGKEGRGLAYRWAKAGHTVYIGSRTPAKAARMAETIRARLGNPQAPVWGVGNREAAQRAEVVVLAVPYSAHRATLEAIREVVQGKVVVDVAVPLKPPKVTKAWFPPAGSAALEAQEILGPDVAVVDAFQNIAHAVLWEDAPIEAEVLVAGKGKANRRRVMALVEDAGLRAWDAGPLENTPVVEGLTSVLIYMNKALGTRHVGIRIVGGEEE
ncbi:MAG TPA: NADPH-dependent F420 reductase [Chloroflexi bacterium]|nr:NADPH-dependent F420 reductase [Chloroflexota bacterium]